MALFRNLIMAISSAGSSRCKQHQATKGQGKEELQQEYALALYDWLRFHRKHRHWSRAVTLDKRQLGVNDDLEMFNANYRTGVSIFSIAPQSSPGSGSKQGVPWFDPGEPNRVLMANILLNAI